MSECIIKIFKHGEVEVRYFEENGELWFVAKDISKVLNLNSQQVRNKVSGNGCRKQHIKKGKIFQNHLLLSESGFYTLLMKSRKVQAFPFQEWLTKQALPALRKSDIQVPVVEQDYKVKADGAGYIYAFYDNERMICRFGCSEDPERSFESISSSCGAYDYVGIKSVLVADSQQALEHIKIMLEEHRTRGRWYDLRESRINRIFETLAPATDSEIKKLEAKTKGQQRAIANLTSGLFNTNTNTK